MDLMPIRKKRAKVHEHGNAGRKEVLFQIRTPFEPSHNQEIIGTALHRYSWHDRSVQGYF
jgi:hypothetical protein